MFSGCWTLTIFTKFLLITCSLSSEIKTKQDVIRLKRQTSNTAPVFAKDEYRVSVPENQAAGFAVIQLTATDPDQGEDGKIDYSMTSISDSRRNDMFTINPVSGQVITTQSLDREEIPRHDFIVMATDNNVLFKKSAVTMLLINIEDENDNAPTFDQTLYRGQVYENTPIATIITTIRATDRDSGKDQEIRYSIVSPANESAFKIDPISGSILTLKILDREVQANYQLIVQAQDQADFGKQLSSFATVEIHVLDVNDNAPEFTQHSYTAYISEGSALSSQITRVSATDRDAGRNQEIKYSIVGGNVDGVFGINSTSGEVILQQFLDYEVRSVYVLRIEASDNGQVPKSNTTTLEVIIVDINDNAPVFQKTNYTATVQEDVNIGALILIVKAIDVDSGVNGMLEYLIPHASSAFPFTIDSAGRIFVSGYLDRESKDYYLFKVEAKDHGTPPLESTATVEIRINDINDNSPAFINKHVFADLLGNAPLGQYVTRLNAIDIDIGNNSDIRYNIIRGNSEKVFRIGSKTGVITLVRALNHTNQDSFILTVTASDGIHIATSEVHINVTYSNKRTPSFLNESYQFSVYEDVDIGTYVGKVHATGEAQAQNVGIIYELLRTNAFIIDPKTGEIRTSVYLDHEVQLSYWFDVVASVSGDHTRQATAGVSVSVKDQNDNPPIFSKSVYEASIRKPVSAGKIVTTVHAIDADFGINSQIRYSLSAANNILDDFKIDSMSGVIFIAKSNTIDMENRKNYTLAVLAVDGGVVRFTAQSLVRIKVVGAVVPVG